MSARVGDEAIKGILEEAAAVVRSLPESLQPVAYAWLLDRADTKKEGGTKVAHRRSVRNGSKQNTDDSEGDAVASLMQALVRTDYPEIALGKRALDLALGLLKASKSTVGIEWLTPQEMSTVLKDKFGIKTEAPALRMALKSSELVDRRPLSNGGFTYRIMAAGEQYLEKQVVKIETDR